MDVQDYPPLDPEAFEPPVSAVKCGNRTDLPRKRRVHDPRYAGTDLRTSVPGFKVPTHIAICLRCGTEKRSPVRSS